MMTNLFKYYIEIKNRGFLILIAWITTILVSYIYKETLLFLVLKPSLNYSTENIMYFIFTDVTEIFSVYFRLITFFGNHTLLIYTLYHFILFLSLGLYKIEQNNLVFITKVSFCLFLLAIFIFSKVLLPISWHFFLSFQSFSLLKSVDLYFESKINEYLTFFITSYYICIFYCQFFVFLIYFFKHIKTNIKKVKSYRKGFYCSFILVSTLITPPDIISQISLSTSIILMYEILLWNLISRSVIKTLTHFET